AEPAAAPSATRGRSRRATRRPPPGTRRRCARWCTAVRYRPHTVPARPSGWGRPRGRLDRRPRRVPPRPGRPARLRPTPRTGHPARSAPGLGPAPGRPFLPPVPPCQDHRMPGQRRRRERQSRVRAREQERLSRLEQAGARWEVLFETTDIEEWRAYRRRYGAELDRIAPERLRIDLLCTRPVESSGYRLSMLALPGDELPGREPRSAGPPAAP